MIPAGRRVRLRKGELLYRAGAILEIRVTGRARIGKFTRLRIRRGRAPARLDRCLAPGAHGPAPAPSQNPGPRSRAAGHR